MTFWEWLVIVAPSGVGVVLVAAAWKARGRAMRRNATYRNYADASLQWAYAVQSDVDWHRHGTHAPSPIDGMPPKPTGDETLGVDWFDLLDRANRDLLKLVNARYEILWRCPAGEFAAAWGETHRLVSVAVRSMRDSVFRVGCVCFFRAGPWHSELVRINASAEQDHFSPARMARTPPQPFIHTHTPEKGFY